MRSIFGDKNRPLRLMSLFSDIMVKSIWERVVLPIHYGFFIVKLFPQVEGL